MSSRLKVPSSNIFSRAADVAARSCSPAESPRPRVPAASPPPPLLPPPRRAVPGGTLPALLLPPPLPSLDTLRASRLSLLGLRVTLQMPGRCNVQIGVG